MRDTDADVHRIGIAVEDALEDLWRKLDSVADDEGLSDDVVYRYLARYDLAQDYLNRD